MSLNLTVNEKKGSHGKTALYIINNDIGGWEIVSGTKVESTILAYSEQGEFDIDIETMNPGLKLWIGTSIANMVYAYHYPEEYNSMFKRMNIGGKEDPPDEPCDDIHTQVSNFVTALYSQHWPENAEAKTCSSVPSYMNGHAYIGCGPVAMAQVMQYYETPSSYDWSIIPNNPSYVTGSSSAELEVGELFGDIVDALEPYYFDILACTAGAGTLTSTYNNLDNSFDVFGYDAYEFSSSATLENEMTNQKPVIAVGGSTVEEGRHIWVMSGRKSSYYCETGNSYLWLWCNWGWQGSSNGWYGISGYTPAGNNFNSNIKYFRIVKR